MKLLLYLSFLGTNYNGYQVQKNENTIQKELNTATEKLFGYPCDVVGCSRTDSGVHANMFCVAVSQKKKNELNSNIEINSIIKALNTYLPDDISVFRAEWVSSEFHPRYDVKSKEYIYRFYNAPVRSPFENGRSCHCPKKLDDRLMDEATKYFIGQHDFTSFMATGSKIEDAVRTVFAAEVRRTGNVIEFKVSANGFLYNMVRIMAGTLLLVGEGKIEPAEIKAIIEAGSRQRAGKTMPACGLYLNNVIY